jgi:hypothetical protein
MFFIILAIIYTLFWVSGYFVTLFQMADDQISKKIASRRLIIFSIMGVVELISAFISFWFI